MPRSRHRLPGSAVLALLAVGCQPESPDSEPAETLTPLGGNVLILLTDDIGIDKTAAYGEHPTAPPTPTIDDLAAAGLLFRNAYAHPTCSPTRASLLTGRHPSRHGLGRWIYADTDQYSLPAEELTIPQMLAQSPDRWTSAALGKWHLVGFADDEPHLHPQSAGFSTHAGSLGNPLEAIGEGHTPRGYENWEKSVNGELTWTTTYMTVDTIDDAIAAIADLPEPWFLYVATNGAHTPTHNPPEALLAEPLPEDATELEQYTAMVEVVDTQLGRLLGAIPSELRDRTTVIYSTDNGTPSEVDVIQEPWDPERSKQTVYEGGVNVPLIVTGPLVAEPGTESAAFVSIVDILPTVAAIAGVNLENLTGLRGSAAGRPITFDGYSLVPYLSDPDAPSQHEYAYSEQFYPNGNRTSWDWRNRMVRNVDWKLIRNEVPGEGGAMVVTHEFFRMEEGAWDEGEALEGALDAEEQAAYDTLMGEMDRRAADLVYGHPDNG